MNEAARSLRTAERFLLAPPLAATYGDAAVGICDISSSGARFRHDIPLETGAKAILRVNGEGDAPSVSLEALIVWSQPDASSPGKYMSGVRVYAAEGVVTSLVERLRAANRASRIEELRSTDRFFILPALPAMYDGSLVHVEDLSARGARIELPYQPQRGQSATLELAVPQSEIELRLKGEVVWTSIKALAGAAATTYRAGLLIAEKPELIRLAIGRLCEINRAAIDTQSLRLKLKIIRARARQLAPAFRSVEASGIPAEQFLLIQGVREELRVNPDEAMHWYRRARLVINDPATRTAAPQIANHPDALAVWEYLDRSVDPSFVGRAFELP